MIAIDNILISDEVIEKNFVCHLEKCKGGCCVEGDAGAPLEKSELKEIKNIFPLVKNEMSAEALEEVKQQGKYVIEKGFGYVTPIIGNGICVYGYYDENKIVKCLIEKAYYEGKTAFKKPISCHLFPIRVSQQSEFEVLNYEGRTTLCKPACVLGDELKVPVYKFLKEPLIRKYGEEFYEALEAAAVEHGK